MARILSMDRSAPEAASRPLRLMVFGAAASVSTTYITPPILNLLAGALHGSVREIRTVMGGLLLRILPKQSRRQRPLFAEAGHLLKPYPAGLFQLLAALHAGHVRFLSVFPEHAPRCAELIRKFAPHMNEGDASLVILSERYPAAPLVTIDAGDFNLYRRRDGRPVPGLMPAAKLSDG